MIKLSKRLQTIAGHVPQGSRLADIGSDHALLPVFLAQHGVVDYAVAGELNPGPFEAALRQVERAGVDRIVRVRRGDGLRVIQAGEVNVVVIAGMGGHLIARILSEGSGKLTGVNLLVLQPNVGEDLVRRWLDQNGWNLSGESIIEEDGQWYEILTAVPKRQSPPVYPSSMRLSCGLSLSKESLYRYGPHFVRQAPAEWHRKWEQELAKLERIHRQIRQSNTDAALRKEPEIREQIQEIREVLACLRKDKP
jgi:tRNA (adenine22-N1)-methyltransferase